MLCVFREGEGGKGSCSGAGFNMLKLFEVYFV